MFSTFVSMEIEEILDSIGAKIRRAREEAELTQVELGDALGISGNAVARIERGRNALILKHLLVLPKILNKPIEWFLDLPGVPGLTPDEEELLSLYRSLPVGTTRAQGLDLLRAWAKFQENK